MAASYLTEQFHTQVLQGDRAVHLFLLLQKQHEEASFHVPQQVTGPVGIHAVVAHDCALLHAKEEALGSHCNGTTSVHTGGEQPHPQHASCLLEPQPNPTPRHSSCVEGEGRNHPVINFHRCVAEMLPGTRRAPSLLHFWTEALQMFCSAE